MYASSIVHRSPLPFVHLNTAFAPFKYIAISLWDVQKEKVTWKQSWVSTTKQDQCKRQAELKTIKLLTTPVLTAVKVSRCCQNTRSHDFLPSIWSKWQLLWHPLIFCHEVTKLCLVIFKVLKPNQQFHQSRRNLAKLKNKQTQIKYPKPLSITHSDSRLSPPYTLLHTLECI